MQSRICFGSMLNGNWFRQGDPKRMQKVSSCLLPKPIRFGHSIADMDRGKSCRPDTVFFANGKNAIMPESARVRHEEFHNLRPIILILCFFWGVAMGFALNFFKPAEPVSGSPAPNPPVQSVAPETADAETRPMSELERRHAGTPAIAAIDPAPLPPVTERLSFENAVITTPPVALTTEGGLTGKNARQPKIMANPAAIPGIPAALPAAPLIPDLDP